MTCRLRGRVSTDERASALQTDDFQPQPTGPLSPSFDVPPTLRDSECYHVFISYSSTDYQWTHSLIEQLESCSLQVCYHERDFTPGRTVLENMSDCIQESQKVLLVLSPEFVRSRWCLLEANMSLFRDCLERKPIVPVLLEPGVSIPLHLCHLTYLEASDPEFKSKLFKVLCTPNQQLQGSTVVPFQPPSIYNGKALQPLTAVNDEGLHTWDSGQFSDMEVPDQLRLIIEDHNKYREAVRILNSVSEKVWHRPVWVRALLYFSGVIFFLLMVAGTLPLIVLMFLSGYACCLAKRHFPFPKASSTGHLEGGVCFCHYSSTDYHWTHSLIEQLESCGLQVCYHERNFSPGRTVLENMSNCIQESQKVLLVLSPEL
ncbi:uncharacterized protein LOC117814054 [Notolabrus celidotus]|uniref:uncharacterized protein LOC117814054 n=1 Tax=Notolabrus celidotus TaxID=1203425 RepID=UPI0014903DA1|nr:uncharacterized protein LOC117814054 [Notolabrus celidotus]